MINEPSSVALLFQTTWYWLSVISITLFVAGFSWRWAQTHKISDGHALIGFAAITCNLFYLFIVAGAPAYKWFFGPFATLSTVSWLFYNNWYYHDYPGLSNWIDSDDRPLNTFGMNTSLARFLTGRNQKGFNWSTEKIKTVIISSVIVFAFGFGFVQKVNGIADGQRREQAARQEGTLAVKQAVVTVKKEVAQAVAIAVDTLTKGQAKLSAKDDSLHRVDKIGREQIKRELSKATRKQNQKLDQVNRSVERTRNSIYYTPAPIRPQPASGGIIPTERAPKYNPVKYDRHGKAVSENEMPIDEETGNRTGEPVTVRKNNDDPNQPKP